MKEKLKRFFVKDDSGVKEQENKPDTAEEKTDASDVKDEVATEKDIYGYTLGEIKEFADASGEHEMLTDLLSEQFSVFARGRKGNLGEKYTAFKNFKKLMATDKEDHKEPARGLSGQDARVHSGFSGNPVKDVSSGLTKRQMDMAKSAGMSFREYEQLLSSVPAKIKNKF